MIQGGFFRKSMFVFFLCSGCGTVPELNKPHSSFFLTAKSYGAPWTSIEIISVKNNIVEATYFSDSKKTEKKTFKRRLDDAEIIDITSKISKSEFFVLDKSYKENRPDSLNVSLEIELNGKHNIVLWEGIGKIQMIHVLEMLNGLVPDLFKLSLPGFELYSFDGKQVRDLIDAFEGYYGEKFHGYEFCYKESADESCGCWFFYPNNKVLTILVKEKGSKWNLDDFMESTVSGAYLRTKGSD